MPILSEAEDEYRDLRVVGIAIDDGQAVARFLDKHPVNYLVLIGNSETIELSRRLGNRLQGLPFTVIFDHQGKRIHSQIGEITRASLERHIGPLLEKTAATQTARN
jgi:hypothetical protein